MSDWGEWVWWEPALDILFYIYLLSLLRLTLETLVNSYKAGTILLHAFLDGSKDTVLTQQMLKLKEKKSYRFGLVYKLSIIFWEEWFVQKHLSNCALTSWVITGLQYSLLICGRCIHS
jgi:hypothetical protein